MAAFPSGKVRLQAKYRCGQCKEQQTDGRWIVGMAAQERSWALGIHFELRGQQ